MKIFLNVTIVILFLLSNASNLKAAPFDTGMIILTQPNDVTFTGRIWGDEFFYWAETESGYRFVQSGDGWYYYATLDQSGEFTKTAYKVGIDQAPPSSYKLERTQARIDEINQQVEEFNEQIELNRQWYAQKQAEAQGQAVTLQVGIILIEFTDVKHYKTDPTGNRPNGYYKSDFEDMMFSENYWIGDPGNLKHPEEEEIFGSFRDYWHQMSRGKLIIEGQVVNPEDENGVPIWIEADSTKEYYASLGTYRDLAYEAIQAAIDSGYIDSTYDKYAVVYANDAVDAGALLVHAESNGGKYHFIPERSGPQIYGDGKSFTHIGIYAHEFGHTIGFPDEYAQGTNLEKTDIFTFCLMARGIYNGPLDKGECPATLSPYHRLKYYWVSSDTITEDKNNFLVEYDYVNPKLYRINPIYATNDEHYIIETRKREGFDLWTPGNPADTVNQPGRLLVWHHDIDPYPFIDSTDRILITPADNEFNDETKITDFFPDQFSPNTQTLNDTTLPGATLGRIGDNFSNERPAHFSLNGIQKLSNGNTYINEIKINEYLSPDTISITQSYNGGWQMASVPVVVSDFSLQSVFPTAISAFKYFNGYQPVNILENGWGYWTNFETATQKVFLGWPLDYLEFQVFQGWHLIGTISSEVPVPNICTEPPGIIISIWGYENGYIPMTKDSSLIPGKGYWVNIEEFQPGLGYLILDKYGEPCQLPKITSFPEIDLAAMDKFTVTDAEGNSQSLYVSNIDIDTVLANTSIDLPPMLPEIDFDSRFDYNEFIKRVSADSGLIDMDILVHTNDYPVSLSWEINPDNGINYSFIGDSTQGKISSINSKSGKTSFNELVNNKIQLFASTDRSNSLSNIPTEYALYQNYPNPFNPITTIKYDVPKQGKIELIIYDILGRKVTTLINEQKQPGRYEAVWNASNAASGIYIYQLRTNDFVDNKKMILLK